MIDQQALYMILAEVHFRVSSTMGDGPKAKTILDMEQLQVADYSSFEGVSEIQRTQIREFHAREPVRPEEMIYLALRSLIQFVWPEPQSHDELRYAAAHDFVLDEILVRKAVELAPGFSTPEGLLPYWGRLAFLKVMSRLPNANVDRFGLGGVACALVKDAQFNAKTWAFRDGSVITMNYALEPILKHFNRFILHYHDTQPHAGPRRLARAWSGIVPTVLHFWAKVSATRLTRSSAILHDENTAATVQWLTNDQIEFIAMHELGHVALDHADRLKAARSSGADVRELRHEFEFGADAFALELLRSRLIGSSEDPKSGTDVGPTPIKDWRTDYTNYQHGIGAMYLLFTYMDFVQRAGELLGSRLAAHIPINQQSHSHPGARSRLDRLELMHLGEHLYTSPLLRYASGFLQDILNYASGLDDDSLLATVESD
ncbi:M48 family metalloprotease [Tsuneonella flava]|uniref:hypothetical protein n=1 Tax=Tsuneonella flava TaxID=2055955 RepID=UPI0019685777|nr:hypothetical protein [Tsuneonella flava]